MITSELRPNTKAGHAEFYAILYRVQVYATPHIPEGLLRLPAGFLRRKTPVLPEDEPNLPSGSASRVWLSGGGELESAGQALGI